mmetsp:Transcript_18585/g.53583  ORF Transcript_18585/g.53583 Transcript_18585/m.53583 type:complete len:94 (-) Transcript_18585:6-287(-)
MRPGTSVVSIPKSSGGTLGSHIFGWQLELSGRKSYNSHPRTTAPTPVPVPHFGKSGEGGELICDSVLCVMYHTQLGGLRASFVSYIKGLSASK